MIGTEFWASLLQIVAIDILLGGDNAVVIALACRNLPEIQKKRAMLLGVAGAVGVRLALMFFALSLLKVAYLKMVAALFLFWIGVNLLGGEAKEGESTKGNETLFSAIRTIIVADAVMSLDNIVGVAGAARDDMMLVALGISISVPIILWGSRFVLTLMDRFPVLVTAGAGLIGWISGSMLVSDAAYEKWVRAEMNYLSWASPFLLALMTVVIGKWRASRRAVESRDLGNEYE